MTAGFMAQVKTPERTDMLTICSRSGVSRSEPGVKNPAGKISRQQEEDLLFLLQKLLTSFTATSPRYI